MSPKLKINEQIISGSREKLGRLYRLFKRKGVDESELKKFLDEQIDDINYRLPDNLPYVGGYTALHLAIEIGMPNEIVELLLEHGADPTIKNGKGLSSIHYIFKSRYCNKIYEMSYMMLDQRSERLIKTILAAQVRRQNSTNPRNPDGFSHFHVACLANDIAAVEFFLNNGVPIDEATNADMHVFSGYTPLHFAARFRNIDVVNVLLDRGANLHLRDATGMTPLHLAIQRNMAIFQYMHLERHGDNFGWFIECHLKQKDFYLAMMDRYESVIVSILSKIDKKTINMLGLSAYNVMQTLKDSSLADNGNNATININEQVDVKSAIWPGFTALHFAALLNVDTFKLLIERGADIDVKDAHGDTPFDMCAGIFEIGDIRSILSDHNTARIREILLSDGKTKFADLLCAMQNTTDFVSFLEGLKVDINDISVSIDSPLWPGSTILHLAVILSKKCICTNRPFYKIYPNKLVEICLGLGANVNAQDRRGSTPLHLAFRRLDMDNVPLLLEHLEANSNPVDRDNLSHLHIACGMDKEELVKKLIEAPGVELNGALSCSFQWDFKALWAPSSDYWLKKAFIAGSTPLNVTVITCHLNYKTMRKLLIEAGADLDAKDADGLSPLEHIIRKRPRGYEIEEVLRYLFQSKDIVVDGLNRVRDAACSSVGFPSARAIEELLNLDEVNMFSAVIAWNSACDVCSRRIEVAELYCSIDSITSSRGHRYFLAGKSTTMRLHPVCEILHHGGNLLKYYVSVLNDDDDERRLIKETGVTKLHMACKLLDEKMIRDCVKKGTNVNAQIHNDSMIWPGYTPLHVLVGESRWTSSKSKTTLLCRIVRLLLKNGADVTIADVKGETPIIMDITDGHLSEPKPFMAILMKSLKKTNVNPVSAKGISHFHVACLRRDVALIRRFLKLGVDVNQRIDDFADTHWCRDWPGYTPLHCAVVSYQSIHYWPYALNDLRPLITIHLLLKHGADVHARNLQDETPLHIAARYCTFFSLPYKRILWAGADPKTPDSRDGFTPERIWNHEKYRMKDLFFPCLGETYA